MKWHAQLLAECTAPCTCPGRKFMEKAVVRDYLFKVKLFKEKYRGQKESRGQLAWGEFYEGIRQGG